MGSHYLSICFACYSGWAQRAPGGGGREAAALRLKGRRLIRKRPEPPRTEALPCEEGGRGTHRSHLHSPREPLGAGVPVHFWLKSEGSSFSMELRCPGLLSGLGDISPQHLVHSRPGGRVWTGHVPTKNVDPGARISWCEKALPAGRASGSGS